MLFPATVCCNIVLDHCFQCCKAVTITIITIIATAIAIATIVITWSRRIRTRMILWRSTRVPVSASSRPSAAQKLELSSWSTTTKILLCCVLLLVQSSCCPCETFNSTFGTIDNRACCSWYSTEGYCLHDDNEPLDPNEQRDECCIVMGVEVAEGYMFGVRRANGYRNIFLLIQHVMPLVSWSAHRGCTSCILWMMIDASGVYCIFLFRWENDAWRVILPLTSTITTVEHTLLLNDTKLCTGGNCGNLSVAQWTRMHACDFTASSCIVSSRVLAI